MIDLIITGHGNFATGIESNIELIAGKQPELVAIDFKPGMPAEELSKIFSEEMKALPSDEIVFLTDIPGGTPFNEAVKLKMTSDKHVEVISGINVPMILENMLNREDQLEHFVDNMIQTGEKTITKFKMKPRQTASETEGI